LCEGREEAFAMVVGQVSKVNLMRLEKICVLAEQAVAWMFNSGMPLSEFCEYLRVDRNFIPLCGLESEEDRYDCLVSFLRKLLPHYSNVKEENRFVYE